MIIINFEWPAIWFLMCYINKGTHPPCSSSYFNCTYYCVFTYLITLFGILQFILPLLYYNFLFTYVYVLWCISRSFFVALFGSISYGKLNKKLLLFLFFKMKLGYVSVSLNLTEINFHSMFREKVYVWATIFIIFHLLIVTSRNFLISFG